MHYQDLEIEIDHCCCRQQEIRILESSYDRPRERFVLDDERRAALAAKVEELEELLLKPGEENASRRRELAQGIGIELHRVLFAGRIQRTYERCHAALDHGGDGLRLRLSFGRPGREPDDPDASYDYQLGSLPWELLCDPETSRYLGNRRATPLVRYLDLGQRIQPLPVTPPLKVLGVVAAPDPATSQRYDFCAIDPQPHRHILEQAIGSATYLQLRHLEGRTTLPRLRKKLRAAERAGKPFHVLHFIGHGGFNSEGEGVLFFEREDPADGEHLVTGAELARQLTHDVRVVVLASCNTGDIPLLRRNGQHPFAGVASALVAAGKPAVVAMQFPVSEAAISAFAEAFYGAIDGDGGDGSIDAAVTEGRLSIEAHGDEGGLEWATPVLFLRSPDGRVLNLNKTKIPAKTVAVFNTLDHGKEKIEQSDFQVDLRAYFDGRFIRDPKHWNGAVMEALRHTLRNQLPAESPCHFELAAPLSVAFACGFLLPAKVRRPISIGQRDETWHLDADPPAYAARWLDEEEARAAVPADFPFDPQASDVALVIGVTQTAIKDVADYLERQDLDPAIAPPRIRDLVYAGFESPDQVAIKDGGHARRLAQELAERIHRLTRSVGRPTTHIFLAGPQGLAVALGRLSHSLARIQLYEYDFNHRRHGTYEPSITLVPPRMGEAP